MLLFPLEEDVDKYKKKNTELLTAMNEYKDKVDMTFEEFLKNFAKMDFDDQKLFESSKGLLITKNKGYEDKFV